MLVSTCSPVTAEPGTIAGVGPSPDGCSLPIALRGEGHRRLVRRKIAAVLVGGLVGVATLPAHAPLGELLLELARIEQDEPGQLDGAVGRPDRPAEALLHHVRDEPAVVEMGVRQQDRVERGRVEGERDPVADRLVRAPLEHAAVDEDPCPLGGQQELRAGHRRRGPEELEVHRAECATARPGVPDPSHPLAAGWRIIGERRPIRRRSRSRRPMAEYSFVTVWRLEAPIDRVYDLIRDSLHQETPA